MEFTVTKGCSISKAEFIKKKSYLTNVCTLNNFGVFGLMYVMEKVINLNIAIKVVLRRAYTVLYSRKFNVVI